MKNNRILIGVSFGVLFALYNVLVFTFTSNFTTVFWFVYGFTVLAFILQVISFFVSYGRKTTPNKTFFGIPLTLIGLVYLCIQVAISSIFMIFADMSLKVANIIQIIILAVYIVVCSAALFAKNAVTDIDNTTKEKLLFIKLLENDVIALQERVTEPALITRLESIAELIKYSDPMRHPSLALVEQKITNKIDLLTEKAQDGKMTEVNDLCNEIELLMADRNRKCKILK